MFRILKNTYQRNGSELIATLTLIFLLSLSISSRPSLWRPWVDPKFFSTAKGIPDHMRASGGAVHFEVDGVPFFAICPMAGHINSNEFWIVGYRKDMFNYMKGAYPVAYIRNKTEFCTTKFEDKYQYYNTRNFMYIVTFPCIVFPIYLIFLIIKSNQRESKATIYR